MFSILFIDVSSGGVPRPYPVPQYVPTASKIRQEEKQENARSLPDDFATASFCGKRKRGHREARLSRGELPLFH